MNEKVRERAMCHDCGALEGALHERGCDMERCPFCGHQLITCYCRCEFLGLPNPGEYGPNTEYLSPYVYSHGLNDKQQAEWLRILTAKGRIPWVEYPNICAKCGKLWPEMFQVPDEEWQKYIEPVLQGGMLCQECFSWIKELIDQYAGQRIVLTLPNG